VKREAAETVFEGRMVAAAVERWDGRDFDVVERADSVAIVAVDLKGSVVLVRQFRPPARRELLELPAGTIGKGEEPAAAARRELAEEVGLGGGRWETGPVFYSTPGFCRERIHLFFAEAVETARGAAARGEEVEVVRWRLDELATRLGEIEDAKTLAGLLLYLRTRG
jgi:ADP-ribose pyrophosphatase